jgi:site-specific recombinase XerD
LLHSSRPNDRLADFVTGVYLPWVKETQKPSTYKGYNDVWDHHLKAVSSRERASLKDIRTFTVQRWLNQIGQENLSRNSLKRIQSVLSGIFKQAKRLGYYDGVNPVQDTAVNPHAARPAETYAYSLEEIQSILTVFPNRLRPVSQLRASQAYGKANFRGLNGQTTVTARCTSSGLFGMARLSNRKLGNPRLPSR